MFRRMLKIARPWWGNIGITVASLLFHVSTPKLILAIVAMCIAIWRHKENIQRLLNGTEPNFRAAKPKK